MYSTIIFEDYLSQTTCAMLRAIVDIAMTGCPGITQWTVYVDKSGKN